MPWFRVDDSLPHHRKTLSIPRKQRLAAMGLWSLAGAWCAANLSEGFVPDYVLEELAGTKQVAAQLVAAGFWQYVEGDEGAPSGYQFHNWLERNPSREKVEQDKAAAAERQRKARDAARLARERSAGVTA